MMALGLRRSLPRCETRPSGHPSGRRWNNLGGTTRGLYGESGKAVISVTTAQGLPSHFVGQILEDKKGGLWVNGPSDVTRLPLAELRALAEGQLSRISPRIYPFPRNSTQPKFTTAFNLQELSVPTERCFIPSNKGLVRIQPELQTAFPAFPIIVESVTVDGRAVPVTREITLGASTSRTEITFAPALLGPQERINALPSNDLTANGRKRGTLGRLFIPVCLQAIPFRGPGIRVRSGISGRRADIPVIGLRHFMSCRGSYFCY